MNSLDVIHARLQRAEVLRATRKAYRISKMSLAKRSGLSRNTIDRIEKGTTSWTVDTERIYLDGLNIVK